MRARGFGLVLWGHFPGFCPQIQLFGRLRRYLGRMTRVFPEGFIWGTATAGHQVEGNNDNSDWWEYELRPDSPAKEPSGDAIDHYHRYPEDIALLASLGFGMYRYSVEWSRIEPSEGVFDSSALAHYREMTEAVRAAGMEPMVTLNHFTIPRWLADKGGWLCPEIPDLFARYCGKVVAELGDLVTWYCTINEPGIVAFGGYLGAFSFPPGTSGIDNWEKSIEMLVQAHHRSRAVIKDVRPEARLSMTHGISETEHNWASAPMSKYVKYRMVGAFLDACADDEFIGIQCYSRSVEKAPWYMFPMAWLAANVRPIGRRVIPRVLAGKAKGGRKRKSRPDPRRLTDIGWEYRPQAVAAVAREIAGIYPDKDILVTENGIAAADDKERVEFITEALSHLHRVVEDGIRLRGYIHWSAFDNFEWAEGYRMQFGLIGVDRSTQERTVKPSALLLGEIARTNRLPD